MRARRLWFSLLLALLLGQRLLHFGPALDEPHVWRQMDTAHYARAFAEEGFDLLRPSVCFLGAHKTLALEFPLPEAVMALAWRLVGTTDLWVARGVSLLFFVAALAYAHGLFAVAWDADLARWATLVYASSPLALFYSRAVHIDFFALACVHAVAFHALRGVRDERRSDLIWAAAWLLPALLVKAPYVLPVVPLAAWAAHERARLVWLLKSAVLALPALGALVAWNAHSAALHAAAPDWSVIADYHRFEQRATWYVGTLAQRLDAGTWATLAGRGLRDVVGPSALPLLLIGLAGLRREARRGAWLAWAGGGALYLGLFYNLNLQHDYYQLPLLAPAALLSGWALRALERARSWRLALAVCALLAAGQSAWSEARYYRVPRVPLAAGEQIRRHTPQGALVIAVWQGLDARAPLVLYPAHRYGWSVREEFLNDAVVERLRRDGATQLAHLRGARSATALAPALAGRARREWSLVDGLRLELYELRGAR